MIFSRELEDYWLNPLSSLASDNNSRKKRRNKSGV